MNQEKFTYSSGYIIDIKNKDEYQAAAEWCNENNATIERQEDGSYSILQLPAPSLDELKTQKLIQINALFSSYASQTKAQTPIDEIYTWDIQKIEAEMWEKDNSSKTPAIDLIALHRNVAREELLQKVLLKVQTYRDYIFTLTGKRQKLEDLIHAAKTSKELEAIEWT